MQVPRSNRYVSPEEAATNSARARRFAETMEQKIALGAQSKTLRILKSTLPRLKRSASDLLIPLELARHNRVRSNGPGRPLILSGEHIVQELTRGWHIADLFFKGPGDSASNLEDNYDTSGGLTITEEGRLYEVARYEKRLGNVVGVIYVDGSSSIPRPGTGLFGMFPDYRYVHARRHLDFTLDEMSQHLAQEVPIPSAGLDSYAHDSGLYSRPENAYLLLERPDLIQQGVDNLLAQVGG